MCRCAVPSMCHGDDARARRRTVPPGELKPLARCQVHQHALPLVFEDRNELEPAPSASTLGQNVMVLSAHSVQSVA